MFVFLLLFALSVLAEEILLPNHHAHKERTAEGAIRCGLKYADIDGDGSISRREIEVTRDLALGTLLSTGLWLADKIPAIHDLVTVQQIFDDCDYNKDDYITMDDFHRMRATCLNTPGKINSCYTWVCEQGPKGVFAHAKL